MSVRSNRRSARREQRERVRKQRRAAVTATTDPTEPRPSDILRARKTKWGLLALFVGSLIIYGLTCARKVTGEDAGELITAAYTFGVAHPPGYPLWCLLAKATATLIPFGEVAFRVAFMSSLLGAATVTLLGALILVIAQSWPAAIAASLGFGLLRDQWSHAVIAEVYTLNSVLMVGCILSLVLWAERKEWRYLNLFALCFGLGLSNHHLLAGLAPVFLLFLFALGWRLLKHWRRLLVATGFLVLGLLPYAYLPIAASFDPPVNWGNPQTKEAFWDHVTRSQYRASAAARADVEEEGRLLRQMGTTWDYARAQGGFIFLALGVLALGWMSRRSRSLLLLLGGITVMCTVVVNRVVDFDGDHESVYASRILYVPAWLALTIAFGWGAAQLLQRIRPARIRLATACVLVALPVCPLVANWESCDYSGYDLVDRYGRQLLASVEENAVVFPTSDHNTFPIIYLHEVEGVRPDVTIGDKYGYIPRSFYAGSKFDNESFDHIRRTKAFRYMIEDWVVLTWERPVYFTRKRRLPIGRDSEMHSEGLWYRAYELYALKEYRLNRDKAAWDRIEKVGNGQPSPSDYTAKLVLADSDFAKARWLFRRGLGDQASRLCQQAADCVPESKEVMNNLASLLAEYERFAEAEELYRTSCELDPDYVVGRRNLATVLRASGRLKEAKTEFDRLLLEEPRDRIAIRSLAEIARDLKDWGEAAYFFQEIGEIEGDYRALRDAGLICLLELKELKRAKALLQTSLRVNPDQPEIRKVEASIKERKRGGKDDVAKKDKKKPQRPEDVLSQARPKLPDTGKSFGGPEGHRVSMPSVPDPTRGLLPNTKAPTGMPAGLPRNPATRGSGPPTPRIPGGRTP